MPTCKYRVVSLDVWGHGPEDHDKYDCEGECEGYTVNDAHYCGEIEVETETTIYNVGSPQEFACEAPTDAAILKVLIEGQYLTPDCTEDVIEIDGESDYTLYLNRKEDGRPLLQIERV